MIKVIIKNLLNKTFNRKSERRQNFSINNPENGIKKNQIKIHHSGLSQDSFCTKNPAYFLLLFRNLLCQ